MWKWGGSGSRLSSGGEIKRVDDLPDHKVHDIEPQMSPYTYGQFRICTLVLDRRIRYQARDVVVLMYRHDPGIFILTLLA